MNPEAAAHLPPGLAQAFAVAAGELGFCSASWLFVREIATQGDALVEAMRDQLGRSFPVLDAVAARWLEGARGPEINLDHALRACAGLRRLLVVGIETDFLDALLPRLPDIEVALLRYSIIEADWDRVLANYGGRVKGVDLLSFQQWAGAQSALLTFLYGVSHSITHVRSSFMRVMGGDVRAQFRSILGWDVLRAPMYVYPRWLAEAPVAEFTHIL